MIHAQANSSSSSSKITLLLPQKNDKRMQAALLPTALQLHRTLFSMENSHAPARAHVAHTCTDNHRGVAAAGTRHVSMQSGWLCMHPESTSSTTAS